MKKKCTVCGELKTRESFRKYSGRSPDGLRPLCKICQRAYEADWRSRSKKKLADARSSRRDRDADYRRKYILENPARYLCSRIKARCQKKGLAFDLDKYEQDLNKRIAAGVCEMTGLPIVLNVGQMKWNSASLDRIEPSLGYIYSNIRVVCFGMNACLGSWGEEVFRMIAESYLRELE